MKGAWNIAYLGILKLDFYFFPDFSPSPSLSLPLSLSPFLSLSPLLFLSLLPHPFLLVGTKRKHIFFSCFFINGNNNKTTKRLNSGDNPCQIFHLNSRFLGAILELGSYSVTFLFVFLNDSHQFKIRISNSYWRLVLSYSYFCKTSFLVPILLLLPKKLIILILHF